MTYILTASGRFDYSSPEQSVAALTIEDVANALAKINRFFGHTVVPWNVAQHSVLTCRLLERTYSLQNVDREVLLAALLHDAPESVLGDVATPLKQLLPDYRALEVHYTDLFNQRFLPNPLTEVIQRNIKWADTHALHLEARACLTGAFADMTGFPLYERALDWYTFDEVRRLTPDWYSSRDLFLSTYRSLNVPR